VHLGNLRFCALVHLKFNNREIPITNCSKLPLLLRDLMVSGTFNTWLYIARNYTVNPVDIGKRANRKFGKRVREMRRSVGWSQDELAFELEIDRSYVSSLERGQRNPTLKTIAKISQTFDVTVSDLCQGV
jgi:DNA-binding XRE family transcriptional regulator